MHFSGEVQEVRPDFEDHPDLSFESKFFLRVVCGIQQETERICNVVIDQDYCNKTLEHFIIKNLITRENEKIKSLECAYLSGGGQSQISRSL